MLILHIRLSYICAVLQIMNQKLAATCREIIPGENNTIWYWSILNFDSERIMLTRGKHIYMVQNRYQTYLYGAKQIPNISIWFKTDTKHIYMVQNRIDLIVSIFICPFQVKLAKLFDSVLNNLKCIFVVSPHRIFMAFCVFGAILESITIFLYAAIYFSKMHSYV
jgi:hypothetical protein